MPRVWSLAAIMKAGHHPPAAGLHLPVKGIRRLIHLQIQKMTSVLISFRRGIALWRSLQGKFNVRKKAAKSPLPNGRKDINPYSFSGFLLCRNAQLESKHSRGFHPRRYGPPDAIAPEQVLRHHRSVQGRYGGTGSCPLLHSYKHPEFHIHGKGILQSPDFRFDYKKKNETRYS